MTLYQTKLNLKESKLAFNVQKASEVRKISHYKALLAGRRKNSGLRTTRKSGSKEMLEENFSKRMFCHRAGLI